MSPIHIRPSAPIAPDALLPGDPGRALALAQLLLEKPQMSNHARGLWGYYGHTESGRPLTIQATGMGGPSAAIVLRELAELGTERAIRVGTCGALPAEVEPPLELGELIVATASIADDGTSARLGADRVCEPDPALTAALEAGGARPERIATTDLFYEDDPQRGRSWIEEGAVAVEMEAAALFALGPKIGVGIACLLAVSDLLERGSDPEAGRLRIDDETLIEAGARMGALAASSLEAATRSGPAAPG